jgi:hypothetical protein
VRDKEGVRRIKGIDLFEYSPVLFGANSMSGTLSLKSAESPEDAADGDEEAYEPIGGEPGQPVHEGGGEDTGGEDTGGEDGAEGQQAEPDADFTELDALADEEPDDDEITPPAVDEEDDAGHDDGDGDEEQKRQFSPQQRRSAASGGAALPDGSYPIKNVEDLKNAIQAFGRAKPEDRAKVKAHIMKRAKALGHPELIPDAWKTGKEDNPAIQDAQEDVQVKDPKVDGDAKQSHESLNRSPKKNWVERAGQLPAYIQHIAKDISEQQGVPLERAIPMAIAAVKRWASGGGGVNADTRAKAAKAVAEWEALKARSHARSAAGGAGKSVEEEIVESIRYPYLPGTYEELRDQIREEAAKALGGAEAEGAAYVEVIGTWPDRAVVSAYTLDEEGKRQAQTFELAYSVDCGDDGAVAVTVEEPELVQLTVSMDGAEEPGEKMLPFPAMLDDVTAGLKLLFTHGEDKAGRVLSGINERKLRGAVEQLVSVLRAAGLEISLGPHGNDQPDQQPEAILDSTAPSTRPDQPVGKAVLDPRLHARAWQIVAEATARRV